MLPLISTDFCGETDDAPVPLMNVLPQLNRTPAGKATIVTKGDIVPMLAELSVRAVTPRHDRTYFNPLATYKSERILKSE